MPEVGASEYSEQNISDIIQGRVRLTGKSEINDPFDLNPSIQFNISPSELYSEMKRIYLDKDIPENLRSLQIALRQEFRSLSVLRKATPNRYRKLKDYWLENTNMYKDTAFSSWSANKGHVLMWAHYASNSAGVCVEMEAGYQLANCPFIFLPVQYVEKRPVIEFGLERFYFLSGGEENLTVLYKSKDWEYENEWRLFGIHGNTAKSTHNVGDYLYFDPSLITRVILGPKVKKRTVHAVQQAIELSSAKPNLVHSRISNDDYGIVD